MANLHPELDLSHFTSAHARLVMLVSVYIKTTKTKDDIDVRQY